MEWILNQHEVGVNQRLQYNCERGIILTMNNQIRRRWIKKAGGVAAVARLAGVTTQAVEKWISNGVPAERVRLLAEASGVPESKIRPDLYDGFVRAD